jgi:D-glycero-D-manno-heptose 1,7-bisphosphate phosphatase
VPASANDAPALFAGDDDIWCQLVNRTPGPVRRGALFLDRDGVMVEEVPYLHRIEDAVIIPGTVAAIRAANARNLPVVVVTNQGGIGLGKYDWPEFARLHDWIWAQLAEADAFVNALLACPHHPKGHGLLRVSDHPDRKPNPGMLTRAMEILPIDPAASWIVGDREVDAQAGKSAGLAGAVHLRSVHKDFENARKKALALADPSFQVRACDNAESLTTALGPLWVQA